MSLKEVLFPSFLTVGFLSCLLGGLKSNAVTHGINHRDAERAISKWFTGARDRGGHRQRGPTATSQQTVQIFNFIYFFYFLTRCVVCVPLLHDSDFLYVCLLLQLAAIFAWFNLYHLFIVCVFLYILYHFHSGCVCLLLLILLQLAAIFICMV